VATRYFVRAQLNLSGFHTPTRLLTRESKEPAYLQAQHAVGDAVLKRFADHVGTTLRESDLLARMGGEEFVFVMPDTDLAQAAIAVERVRKGLHDSVAHLAPPVGVTASFGIAVLEGSTDTLAHLLLHLMDLYGVEDPDGTVIAAAFTHADLAHMVGATRQWVTISLKRMQEKDIVVSRKSRIIVRRPDLLKEMKGIGD